MFHTHKFLNIEITLGDIIRLWANLNKQTKVMEIVDIQISKNDRNKGYGSVVIEALFEAGENLETIKYIGTLSPIDLNNPDDPLHKDRIKHFYEKHGFIVDLERRYISKAIT